MRERGGLVRSVHGPCLSYVKRCRLCWIAWSDPAVRGAAILHDRTVPLLRQEGVPAVGGNVRQPTATALYFLPRYPAEPDKRRRHMGPKKSLAMLVLLLGVASIAAPQEFPTKTVRLIAPFSPGGA